LMAIAENGVGKANERCHRERLHHIN
jgi:hypothetical protein